MKYDVLVGAVLVEIGFGFLLDTLLDCTMLAEPGEDQAQRQP